MDSGSRERRGCSLRHCSNRWLSSNKSGGIAVCGWGMSQLTLHCISESRIIAESSRPIWRDCRKKLNDAIVGLSYDLAVLQVNHIFDRGLGGGEAIRVFDDEAVPLLAEVESALRASGESLALSAEELNEEVKDLAQPFHCVRADLRRLLDELPPASQAEVLVEEESAKAGAEPAQVVGEGLSDAEIIAERSARRQAVVTPILRKKRWKPGTLVTKSGVGKATVYGYLNGTRSYIESENRTAIAQELELDPKDLPD
jgi:hypothetical protein